MMSIGYCTVLFDLLILREYDVGMFTKKQFRELLNKEAPVANRPWKSHRFGNTKRNYGDYLYAQDRDMFEQNYQLHCQENNLQAQSRKS